MIETADIVAARYGISREAQDEYSLASQHRTAAAQRGGRLRRGDRADDDREGGRRQGKRRGAQESVTIDVTNATGPTRRSRASRN